MVSLFQGVPLVLRSVGIPGCSAGVLLFRHCSGVFRCSAGVPCSGVPGFIVRRELYDKTYKQKVYCLILFPTTTSHRGKKVTFNVKIRIIQIFFIPYYNHI